LIKFNLKPPDDESGGFFDLQICFPKKRAVKPGASAQLNWKSGSKKFDIT
jgi:hypothetical protein